MHLRKYQYVGQGSQQPVGQAGGLSAHLGPLARHGGLDQLPGYRAPVRRKQGDLGFHGFLHFFQNSRYNPDDVGPVNGQQFFQIVRIAISDTHAFVSPQIPPTKRSRSKTCGSGRTESAWWAVFVGTRARPPRKSATMLPCESITPLGVPVVPEV